MHISLCMTHNVGMVVDGVEQGPSVLETLISNGGRYMIHHLIAKVVSHWRDYIYVILPLIRFVNREVMFLLLYVLMIKC